MGARVVVVAWVGGCGCVWVGGCGWVWVGVGVGGCGWVCATSFPCVDATDVLKEHLCRLFASVRCRRRPGATLGEDGEGAANPGDEDTGEGDYSDFSGEDDDGRCLLLHPRSMAPCS